MINEKNYKKRNIKTKIYQGSSISPIFFPIYITKVLNKIFEISFVVTSLLFVDDLYFFSLKSLVKELIKVLENIAKKLIK